MRTLQCIVLRLESIREHGYELAAFDQVQAHDLAPRPMEVIGQVEDLVTQPIRPP